MKSFLLLSAFFAAALAAPLFADSPETPAKTAPAQDSEECDADASNKAATQFTAISHFKAATWSDTADEDAAKKKEQAAGTNA